MTIRQLRFAEAYVEGYSATEAAIMAGFSVDSAPTNAYRLLKNAEVVRKIQEISETRNAQLMDKVNLVFSSVKTLLARQDVTPNQRIKSQMHLIQVAKIAMRRNPKISKTVLTLGLQNPDDETEKEPTLQDFSKSPITKE